MRNKILIIVIIILSCFAVKLCLKKENAHNEEKKEMEVTLLNQETNEKSNLELENYIIGVVAAEMPASFAMEALKAQAIAARSYAVYKINTANKDYDLVADVSNQSFITEEQMHEKWQAGFDKYYNRIKEAVLSTKGQVMVNQGNVICAFYFAMSNGYTEDSALVFGEARDYITSVDSSWDKNLKNFEVTTSLTKEEFCQKLNISCNAITISNIEKSKTGRINSLKINNQEFKGTKIRTLLGLRSTDFTIEISDKVNITTRGYGHGVGMSQYGANEMAKLGKNYQDILNYYYQNITIQEINV